VFQTAKEERQFSFHRETKRGKRITTTIQQEELVTSNQDQQSVSSFTHDQYTKLLAMLNKHDLETSVHPSGESSAAAMLVGEVLLVFSFKT